MTWDTYLQSFEEIQQSVFELQCENEMWWTGGWMGGGVSQYLPSQAFGAVRDKIFIFWIMQMLMWSTILQIGRCGESFYKPNL